MPRKPRVVEDPVTRAEKEQLDEALIRMGRELDAMVEWLGRKDAKPAYLADRLRRSRNWLTSARNAVGSYDPPYVSTSVDWRNQQI